MLRKVLLASASKSSQIPEKQWLFHCFYTMTERTSGFLRYTEHSEICLFLIHFSGVSGSKGDFVIVGDTERYSEAILWA